MGRESKLGRQREEGSGRRCGGGTYHIKTLGNDATRTRHDMIQYDTMNTLSSRPRYTAAAMISMKTLMTATSTISRCPVLSISQYLSIRVAIIGGHLEILSTIMLYA